MFAVYGLAGRLYSATPEQLRKIKSVDGSAAASGVRAVGRDAHEPGAEADTPPRPGTPPGAAAYAAMQRGDTGRQPLRRVEQVMSRQVFTLAHDARLADAWRLLGERGVGQAPVVDARGMLVGLLSRADLMPAGRLPAPGALPAAWQAFGERRVAEVMWTPVPSVEAEEDLRRVASALLETGLPGLPVVDEAGTVTGFVSRSDILRAVVADPPLDLWT